MFDALVIGGGFYGVAIASYLADKRHLSAIALVERESALLRRASLRNQARVHNGYHYPRSFTTAFRSRVNLPRFVDEFPTCIVRDFSQLYAISRSNSKVSARQFRRFCADIGAGLAPPPAAIRQLFSRTLIEDIFLVEEYAFDAAMLAERARDSVERHGIELRLQASVLSVERAPSGLFARIDPDDGESGLHCRFVFNCTYSGLNQLGGAFRQTRTRLKHEIAEMALIEMPDAIARLGVTVIDGPFFSAMPYPTRAAHSLSHVRYTPHLHWMDAAGDEPFARLRGHAGQSRADWMLRDAARYMPAIADARYLDSMFEVKTVLAKNEVDDGRPILFEQHEELPGCYSILGGKIDNIYDVLERLDAEPL